MCAAFLLKFADDMKREKDFQVHVILDSIIQAMIIKKVDIKINSKKDIPLQYLFIFEKFIVNT